MNIIFQFFCADGMRRFFVIGKALEFSEAGAFVLVVIWVLRLRSLRSVFKRYPIGVRFWWFVPFARRWQNMIAPTDIDPVGRFRKFFFVMESLLLITGAVKIGYFDLLGIHLLLMMAGRKCPS